MRERKTIWGEKNKKINHDTNYYNKPVMFQMGLVLERNSKLQKASHKKYHKLNFLQ